MQDQFLQRYQNGSRAKSILKKLNGGDGRYSINKKASLATRLLVLDFFKTSPSV